MDLYHLVHLAKNIFDKQDQAVIFTALKPTCRRLYLEIKSIQERLADRFVIAVSAVPLVTTKTVRECVEYDLDDDDDWLDYNIAFEAQLYENLMDVCEGAFGPHFDGVIEMVLVLAS